MAAIRRGETAAGFAALDEALLPVLAGRIDPLWAGDIYCTTIHLCDDLGDLARMREWTESLARWSGPLSETFMYAAVTRVHELQLIAAEGDWDVVEAELGRQSDSLIGAHGWLTGIGYYELGEVRRLRGDVAGAAAAYGRARQFNTTRSRDRPCCSGRPDARTRRWPSCGSRWPRTPDSSGPGCCCPPSSSPWRRETPAPPPAWRPSSTRRRTTTGPRD